MVVLDFVAVANLKFPTFAPDKEKSRSSRKIPPSGKSALRGCLHDHGHPGLDER